MKDSTSLPDSRATECRVPLAGSYTLSYMPTLVTIHLSADIVARMITAKLTDDEWELPSWLPIHYLTSLDNRWRGPIEDIQTVDHHDVPL